MENDMVKRLMWSGLLAGLGAAANILVNRTAIYSGPRANFYNWHVVRIFIVGCRCAGLCQQRAARRGFT